MHIRFRGTGDVYRVRELDKHPEMLRLIPSRDREVDDLLLSRQTLLRMVDEGAVERFTAKDAIEELFNDEAPWRA